MILDNYDPKQKKTLKRFGIISGLIFLVIVILATYHINSLSTSNNMGLAVQYLHITILTVGLIGLGYCVIILKSFNTRIDPTLQYNYDKMIRDLKNSEDKTNLTYGKNLGNKK